MVKIYGQANGVVIWLGDDADDGCQALEDIRIAAAEESIRNKDDTQRIIALLQRSWFERIWIFHEVASARDILIMCGGTAIRGHVFCSGLSELDVPDRLQVLVCSATYLIRGAVFRPEFAVNTVGRASMGELLDMYHNRKATIRHDKVYALLGMSSDDLSVSGLLPNYALPWSNLLQKLIRYLLREATCIESFEERETALIKSKGWLIEKVFRAESDSRRFERQQVEINFTNRHASSKFRRRWGDYWILQVSAESIRQGDIVCLLEGASKPTIIRNSNDYFHVIMIAVNPLSFLGDERMETELEWFSSLSKSFLREFLLVWNWEKPLENVQEPTGHSPSTGEDYLVLQSSKDASDRSTRLFNAALVLKDVEEHQDANKILEELLEGNEKTFSDEHPHQLACKESLALVWSKARIFEDAKDVFLRIIQTRRQVSGLDHPDTLDSVAYLISIYLAQAIVRNKELEITQSLATRVRDNAEITQEEIFEVLKGFDLRLFALLLGLRRDKVVITEEVLKVAAEFTSKEVMALLFNQRGADIQITEEVMKVAAGNKGKKGKEVIGLF